MGLGEAFGISVEEDSAQSIATVQVAAYLIEDLVAAKSASVGAKELEMENFHRSFVCLLSSLC